MFHSVFYFLNGLRRVKYFAFIDTLLAQIGLDEKGIVPDFTDTYATPVAKIVRDLEDLDAFEEMMSEIRFWKEKCRALVGDGVMPPEYKERPGTGFAMDLSGPYRDQVIERLQAQLKDMKGAYDSLMHQHENVSLHLTNID